MTLRIYLALPLSVSAVILFMAGLLALRIYLVYSLVCTMLAMLAFQPVVFSVTMISMALIGQAVFVFYDYPLISVQSAASVAGLVIGSLLMRWSLPRLKVGRSEERRGVTLLGAKWPVKKKLRVGVLLAVLATSVLVLVLIRVRPFSAHKEKRGHQEAAAQPER